VECPDGLLLLAKPEGPTSHDLVAAVRKCLKVRRVGHAGTLDPMASGLLPLVLGRATRLVRFLPDSPKTYVGQVRLGISTDTDDVTGQVLSRHEGEWPAPDRVVAEARRMEGRHPQVPPAFSARKVEGQRMYRLARAGTPVKAEPRVVEIGRFEVRPIELPDLYEFTAEVSAGTYIRALARDLGRTLGCEGALASLRRTLIGPMRVEDAVEAHPRSLDRDRLLEHLVPLEGMPLDCPSLNLADPQEARRFATGSLVRLPAGSETGTLRILGPDGSLLGIGEERDGMLRPKVVLAPASERGQEPPGSAG